jgi:aldehyde:ferredoxin oxidoreductase
MVVKLINSACGLDWTIDEMMRCGERGWNLKRVINNRLGLTKENDRLPKALLRPFEDDESGNSAYVPDFEAMLESYYLVRGWDPNTGFPAEEKLETLGLNWIEL